MAKSALDAYTTVQKTSQSPREIEARAFFKAASMLREAKENQGDRALYRNAVRLNAVLWTIMQADVTTPENTLPDELKANILSLSLFVDRQSVDALATLDPSKLDVLISIDENIALGLSGDLGDGATAGPSRNRAPVTKPEEVSSSASAAGVMPTGSFSISG